MWSVKWGVWSQLSFFHTTDVRFHQGCDCRVMFLDQPLDPRFDLLFRFLQVDQITNCLGPAVVGDQVAQFSLKPSRSDLELEPVVRRCNGLRSGHIMSLADSPVLLQQKGHIPSAHFRSAHGHQFQCQSHSRFAGHFGADLRQHCDVRHR